MARREGKNALQNQLHDNGGENARRSSKARETSQEINEKEEVEIDLTSETEEDKELWLELAMIGRVIGPRMTRSTIREWICKHWGLRLIVKFIPRNFFIVVFEDRMDRNKFLWKDNWMYNLPMEYWGDKCLEKIGRSLGTLLEIDEEIIEEDSYVYARLKIAAVKVIPS
ncbi:hypothetical protein SUGI_0281820 [Cryptomeria japonica]|nr:hypothetical protein SUGI_0281820 [Cryptomeria japonica]